MLHDVCIQELPVTFAIDRAGIVGSDGETHQGIFDLSYLTSIPNMNVMAPKNKWELSDMVKFAVDFGRPIAIRYPRGEAYAGLKEHRDNIIYGKSETIYMESQVALVAVGSMVKTAEAVYHRLKGLGYCCTLVNARFVKPLDTELLGELAKSHQLLVTMEENVLNGGFGEHVGRYLNETIGQIPGFKLLHIAIPDGYVEHGNVDILKQELGIDSESVVNRIVDLMQEFDEI